LKKVLLFVNDKTDRAGTVSNEIRSTLQARGILVDTLNRSCPGTIPGNSDLAFSLGGDGTVLFAARMVSPQIIPVLPVNLGRVGFISAVPPEQWQDIFDQWCAGTAAISSRLMLDVRVERSGAEIACGSCLNDAVISGTGIAMISVHVHTKETRLGQYRSDGLILATPTGSTAYSVSAGGPIVDPEMDALIINPVCPFTLSNRPIVVPVTETITINIDSHQRSGVLLSLDGQVTESLEPGDNIYVKKAPYRAQLVACSRETFYRALSTKLAGSGTTYA
jgi:NAD+ kinase